MFFCIITDHSLKVYTNIYLLQTIIQKGFKYIDITNKIDWQKINKNDQKTVKLEISLNDEASYHIKYVTICSIWKKTNEDVSIIKW